MSNITNQNFNEILQTIQKSKQKAYASVNTILVELYWNIGKHISAKVKEKVWGKGVVQELANFIKLQDPTIKGFSDKNLWRMKQFYEIYQDDEKVATLWRVLPWSHNKRIMSLKNPDEREFDNLRFQNGTMAAEDIYLFYLQNKVAICSQRYLKVKWELTHDI